MKKPPAVIEIFLQPGEFYFGNQDTRIRTLLGSCVAITMWHPRLLIGGMCHFMLPSRNSTAVQGRDLDGRYADEVLHLFQRELRATRTRPQEYQVKLFGGGNMFRAPLRSGSCTDVACRNIRAARELLDHHGFSIMAEHVGEQGHRNIIFDIWSGHVWLKHVKSAALAEKTKEW